MTRSSRRRGGRGAASAAVAGVVGAVLAVAGLSTVVVGHEAFVGVDPAGPETSHVTSHESSHGSTAPRGGAPIDLLSGITAGDPPAVAHLEENRLVWPNGMVLLLPRVYDRFGLLGDDHILASFTDVRGRRLMHVLDASGVRTDRFLLLDDFVLDHEGDVAAWATSRGVVRTRWEGGGWSFGNQGGPVSVAAVVAGERCGARATRCRVYVDNVDGRPPQWVAPDGTVGRVARRAERVADVGADGAVAYQISSSDTGSCSGVRDADGLRWRTCEHSLLRFSPDGRYLLATEAYRDGLGMGSLALLDAQTGEPVVEYAVTTGFIAQVGWEDAEHPLAVVCGPEGWMVLRLGPDGRRELAAGPVAPRLDPTFKLLAVPGNP